MLAFSNNAALFKCPDHYLATRRSLQIGGAGRDCDLDQVPDTRFSSQEPNPYIVVVLEILARNRFKQLVRLLADVVSAPGSNHDRGDTCYE